MSVLPDLATPSQTVGPKAAVLAELRDAGFAVPAFELSPPDLFATMRRLAGDDEGGGVAFAVRSCAAAEDGPAASFAGQFRTLLNVRTLAELEQAVAACRASADADHVHAYCRRNAIAPASLRMDVIVQRMVDAKLAGVAFSVDPLTGEDRVVIEACEGSGDKLLAGERPPLPAGHPLLDRWRLRIEQLARSVQHHFGRPQDIEFAIDDDGLWLLQARPITRITFPADVGEWTNADFRDGGVSASVCSPLMWSLYERAWRQSLLGFLREIRLLGRGESFEAGRMFFGRPYWNLAAVKRCLAKLPGYVERRFDEDLSVEPTYDGDGRVTPVTLLGLLRAMPTGFALRRFFQRQAAFDRDFLRHRFDAVEQRYDRLLNDPAADLTAVLRQLVTEDFMLTECAYFRTIFGASLAKLDFADAFPDPDQAALVASLPPLRHFAPLREIRAMADADAPDADIDRLLHRYRHHHPAGLDIIHPRWDEQRTYVQQLVRDSAARPAPQHTPHSTTAADARAAHLASLPKRKRAGFERKLDRLRTFLYLREEMRDCSSRMYYLIRRCVRRIAEQRSLGDDVFFMTVEQILRDDRSHVATQRDVYQRFRNFEAPNEIRSGHHRIARSTGPADATLHGLAAGRGCVRGRAVVVRSAAEITRIDRDAILICPFIDPGWTCALDRAAAVVTETGGLLSHAAVICREFNLPAVLGVKHATQHIRHGAIVEVDGDRGEVRLLDSH